MAFPVTSKLRGVTIFLIIASIRRDVTANSNPSDKNENAGKL